MPNYYLNEAVFDLPERPFTDKTVHGLEAKLPGDKTLGVLVHRRALEGPDREKTVQQVVDDSVALNQKRLGAFAVLDRADAVVGGAPGVLLRTSWRSAKEDLYQLQAHVLFEGKHMIFAVGAPLDHRAACDETFDALLESITWRAE